MIHSMLATRSHFSLGESMLTVPKLLAEAQRVGATTVAVTDTMSVTALIELTNKAKKANIKPIIGCRLRLVDDPAWRKTKEDKKAPPEFFVTVYVLREPGLTMLFKLLSLANSEERFYNVPKLSFADFYAALDSIDRDDVAIASGDALSVLGHLQAREILTQSTARCTRVYLTLNPVDSPYYDALNVKAIRLARELEMPLIVTRPVLYPVNGADSHEIHTGINKGTKIDEPWHLSMHNRDLHALSDRDLVSAVADMAYRLRARYPAPLFDGISFGDALKRTEELVAAAEFQWKKAPVSLPVMAPDEDNELVLQCRLGWAQRFTRETFGHKPGPAELPVYIDRLKYELKVLRELKFAGYFLLVQDIVKWSKENGIAVGPGRGSVGGSLVAYLLGITDVDPLRFDLLFERFINPGRLDLPDADLDFMSTRRHEVINYITTKWGTDKVAGISNYSALQAASAMRDVGRVCGLDPNIDVGCSKFVLKEHGQNVPLLDHIELDEKGKPRVPEIAKFATMQPHVWTHAVALEGVIRNLGRHAAGVVVGGLPLVERAVVERRQGEPTINWDKRIVEDQGLVKMDILGLATLDVMEIAKTLIFKQRSKKIDLLAIPLDDPKTLEAFAAGNTVGVFQFESGGMRRLLRDLGKDGVITFDDITAATALYRPGPMDSGMMDQYVARKGGWEPISYDHPNMEAALKPTYGVIVYQEQVMQVARDLAGFNLSEADGLRKAMGKKIKEEMAKWRDGFVAGAGRVSGMSETAAGELFDKIEKFAGYGFNKSHAVEYTIISVQAMWLKANFPEEFYAAALTIADGEDTILALLEDAQASGISVVAPDINVSTGIFEILTTTQLAIPFNKLKGISDNTTNAILEARKAGPFTSKADFLDRVEKRKCNVKHQDILERVGAFARIEPGQLPATHPDRRKDQREFLPGLINEVVRVPRTVVIDKFVIGKLLKVVEDYKEAHKHDGACAKPYLGKDCKFMVIMDDPTWAEEEQGQITLGKTFEYISNALDEAGLDRKDAYWTALVKRRRSGKMLSAGEVSTYAPWLKLELDIIKPPVIVCLGGNASRYFIKDLKGNTAEHAGKVVYMPDLDANVIVGFAPGQIAHDPDKQAVLNAVFIRAKNIL